VACGRLYRSRDERGPDKGTAGRWQHVKVADTPDASVSGIRIDIESADTEQAATRVSRFEQRLARSVEAVLTSEPSVAKCGHRSEALGQAGVDQCADVSRKVRHLVDFYGGCLRTRTHVGSMSRTSVPSQLFGKIRGGCSYYGRYSAHHAGWMAVRLSRPCRWQGMSDVRRGSR
jgi:hypothetical protein